MIDVPRETYSDGEPIECPVCGYKIELTDFLSTAEDGGIEEIECDECESDLELSITISIDFTLTEKKITQERLVKQRLEEESRNINIEDLKENIIFNWDCNGLAASLKTQFGDFEIEKQWEEEANDDNSYTTYFYFQITKVPYDWFDHCYEKFDQMDEAKEYIENEFKKRLLELFCNAKNE